MGRAPARKPSFVKILVEDFPKKLLIPAKFIRLHRETLARKCILRPTDTRDSWPVRTKQINNSIYFKKGWKKFAEHHSLGFGDLLVFRYAKDCEFHVEIFDKSCYFKEPVISKNVGSRRQSDPILPSHGEEADHKTPALDAAEELMSSSEFPAFFKIMQRAYVKRNGYMAETLISRLLQPLKPDFARMHLKDSIIRRQVKIEVSGTTWTVGLTRARCHFRWSLNRSWCYLAEEHALKVGDVCVFELINAEDFTLRLSIFSSTSEEKTCQPKARSGLSLEADSNQALETANKFSSLSKYPSYACVMDFDYMQARSLHVPLNFIKQMNAIEGANRVKLQCRGKEWDAVINIHGPLAKMHHGWISFAEQNCLYIGDACVLELINRTDAIIKVTIFKCTN